MEFALKEPTNKDFFKKIRPHAEMIAALLSGLLIAIAWILNSNGVESISVILFLLAFIIGGYAKAKEGIEETIRNKELNVEMLMIFAAIGSAVIGYWTEGAILIFIFALSGALETYSMNKSHKELSALMKLQPEEAWVVDKDGHSSLVSVSDLRIGMHILIKPGERVPIDGTILKGSTTIDEAAITGESLPVSKIEGDELYAGTVNINGAITVEMTKRSSETLFQKIIDLVQSAQSEKSPSQQFIERFEGKYVKAVLIAVGLMMFLPHFLLGWDWMTTFYRAIVLLVVASPCALVASIMPATLSAISNGAKNGILVKGGVHFENLSQATAIAFDKTGTLTNGTPIVTDFTVKDGVNEEEILSIVAGMESNSNHPLSKAIISFARKKGIVDFTQTTITEVPGFGLEAIINSTHHKVGKADFIGTAQASLFQNGITNKWADEGKTIIFVSIADEVVAAAGLKDTIRGSAKESISKLNRLGIHTVMLTGDNEKTAKAIATETGIQHYFANCLPETKVEHVKELSKKYDGIIMVGDGINDAPALVTATTGIAMGEGTDVALETADVVLMKNDLTRIDYAINLSKKMQRIVKQNIVFSLAVILFLIISNFFQVLSLPLGVIGHEGSTILVILNGLRLLKTQ